MVKQTEILAAGVRAHLNDFDARVAEYPQRQFMLSDAELCTVPELVGPGGDHSMPRARCRRIIDESRLRSEFPEYTAQDDLRRQMVQAFRDAEAVDDFDSLRDTFTSKITGIICARDAVAYAAAVPWAMQVG